MKENSLTNIPFQDYRNAKGLGRGGMVSLLKSPRAYYLEEIAKTHKRSETPAMVFGRLVHAMILEGEELKNYKVMPCLQNGTIIFDNKGNRKDAFARYMGSSFYKKEDWLVINDVTEYRGIKDAEFLALDHAEGADNLVSEFKKSKYYDNFKSEHCYKEHSFFYDYGGVKLKGRVDAIAGAKDTIEIYDYKTTTAKTHKELIESIVTYGYDIQGILYIEGMKRIFPQFSNFKFLLIFQNKQSPSEIFHITLEENISNPFIEEVMKEAYTAFNRAIEIYKENNAKFGNNEWVLEKQLRSLDLNEFSFSHLMMDLKNNQRPLLTK